MKLKNTTHWPDHFLRRMVGWCCRQIELPARQVKRAEFGKRAEGAFNGSARYRTMRIRVVIGPPSEFPVEPYHYPGRTSDAFLSPRMADQLEALVAVTAHELQHLYGYVNGRRRGERHTRGEERRIHALFVANKEALIAEWSQEPAKVAIRTPTASPQDKRAAKALAMLERWQRKAKLAASKVKKYKRQVAYYDRRQAAAKTSGAQK